MSTIISPGQAFGRGALDDLVRRGFTRRHMLRVAALLGAGAALPFGSEHALAQLSDAGRLPEDAVKINANEFPEGPSKRALEALAEVAKRGNRYQYPETDALVAEPGYEAAAKAAEFIGAKVVRVPLRHDGSHDLAAMLAAAKVQPVGLFYVCNPNNPTGTVTPRAHIDALLAGKPQDSLVLLDEAYIHFCDEPPGVDLVRADKDVVVLRTFSKVYGMAGLRAGFALARHDLLERMAGYATGALPVTAMAAAHAMLQEPDLVPARKSRNAETRADLMHFFESHGFSYTPSVSNKLMVDARMPSQQVIDELKRRNVYVGRPWPVWPTHIRVSLGSREDMRRFKAAFLEVTAAAG